TRGRHGRAQVAGPPRRDGHPSLRNICGTNRPHGRRPARSPEMPIESAMSSPKGPRTILAVALVAVTATVSMLLNPGAVVAGGRNHPRAADGPPRMVCSAACRATYMKWVAGINADPSTEAGVRTAGAVASDVSHGRPVGLVTGEDTASVPRPTAPTLAAARAPCTIIGTSGPDLLRGTSGDDVICGLQGNDTIYGGGGRDVLRGGRGSDILYGQDGADALYAGRGRGDELHGARGNDYLDARDERPFDLLRGGEGENMCIADAEDHRRGCRHPLVARMAEAVPILLYHVIGDRPPGAPFP